MARMHIMHTYMHVFKYHLLCPALFDYIFNKNHINFVITLLFYNQNNNCHNFPLQNRMKRVQAYNT